MRPNILALLMSLCLGSAGVNANKAFDEIHRRTHVLIERYVQELFPQEDPFALVFNLGHGTALFNSLSLRKQADGTFVKSPLAQVNEALKHWHVHAQEIDTELVQAVLQDADKVINSSGYSLFEKQSNLLALRMLADYLNRFIVPSEVLDRDANPVFADSDEKNTKKTPQNTERPKPDYAETPKEYAPHTKDSEAGKSKGSQADQYIVVEVNFATPFWGQRYFTEVARGAPVPLKDIDLPMSFKPVASTRTTGTEMQVSTYGRTEVPLFMPPGYQPLQPSDPRARISRGANGGYNLKLAEALPQVHIPLQQAEKEPLNPLVLEILTRKVGFQDSEWPSLIRADLFDQFPPGKNHPVLMVAQAVANHISKHYLYSVGKRPEKDPIDALNAGAFQCDMAAFLMVGVLRDVYSIPSRIIGGFRAKKLKDGKDAKSYLVMPGDAHLWVEVYHDGQWHTYDPTPIKKDKKEKKDDEQNGEKDPYSDRALENILKPELEQQEGNSKEKEHDKPQDHEEKLKETSSKREQEQKPVEQEKGTPDPINQMDNDELASKLELGSLTLLEDQTQKHLRNRALRVLLRLILDPRQEGRTIFEGLAQAKELLLSGPGDQIKSIYQEAAQIHQKDHKGMVAWLGKTANLLSSQELSVSYQEIYRIQRTIALFGQTLDSPGPISSPYPILSALDEVLKNINQLAHPDSQEIGLVQEFYRSLPGIIQQLLRQKYGMNTIGANQGTKEIARLLKNGQMNDYQLLSILSPLTDFVLNAVPRPEFEEKKTWERDTAHPRGSDLMPLQRFSELSHSLMLNPSRSVEENLKNGHVFVPVKRKSVFLPTGHGIEEGERVSIVLYDTSGSMSGDLARFQSGLIAAFVGRAISDVSLSGNHRHKVIVVPFDDKPGTPVKISTTNDALRIIDDYQNKFTNTGGGTDIQAALIQALALIADAQNRLGEPLAAANIVLMTDGQSPIDFDALAVARNAISRETPVQTMFVALGDSNDELLKFAMTSKKSGFEDGFYREFSTTHIQEILKEADSNLFAHAPKGMIFTEKSPWMLPKEAHNQIRRAQNLLHHWLEDLQTLDHFVSPLEHLRSIHALKWNQIAHSRRTLQDQLQQLRRFGFSKVFKQGIFLQKIADDLFLNMKSLTGVEINAFDENELAELRHFLNEAAGAKI